MNGPSPAAALWSPEAQRRHLRRNFLALALDGGMYGTAMAFVAAETVLPALLQELGGPTWLIALAPSLGLYGGLLMPLFTAAWIERLPRYLPYVAWASVPQRLPPLVAAIALFGFAESAPAVALWAVALTPLVIGCIGGMNVAAFWELFSKTLPPQRRSSALAARNIIATVLGAGAGAVVGAVLARWPGPAGYARLYLLSFVFLQFSMIALCAVKETPHARAGAVPRLGLRAKLRALPRWLREDAAMRRYVLARVFALGSAVLTPFLAIHAREVLARPASFLGVLVSAQMAGAIAGNLLSGWLGDRRGGRILAQLGGALFLAVSAAVATGHASAAGFAAMFFVLGMAIHLANNGASALMLELFPAERRPTYVALVSLSTLPAALGAAWLAGLLRTHSAAFWPTALAAAALLLVSQWFYHRVPEPRAAGARGA